jgi:hypothetical protein
MYFQYVTKHEFCEVIERNLDRRVRAFVSGTDTEKDVSSEVFYLYPQEGRPRSAGGLAVPGESIAIAGAAL